MTVHLNFTKTVVIVFFIVKKAITQNPEDEWATNISVGSLDHPEKARPYIHMFVDDLLFNN